MLIIFIISSVVCTIGVGGFIGIIVGTSVKKHSVLYGIISAIVIDTILGGLITTEQYNQREDWNNGICIKCGGQYKFKGGSKSMHGYETLYYACEDCAIM